MNAIQITSFDTGLKRYSLAREYDGSDEPQLLGWHDLIEHREYLVRFAMRKLHLSAMAEDIVHDVFEAVVTRKATFCGKSALRSWLTAVLQHKIIDSIRLRARYDSLDDVRGDDDTATEMVCELAGPQEQAQHREELRNTLQRIDALPAALRDVMQFRVLHDESCEEVCKRLQITESSLFVRLHRARKQLLC